MWKLTKQRQEVISGEKEFLPRKVPFVQGCWQQLEEGTRGFFLIFLLIQESIFCL